MKDSETEEKNDAEGSVPHAFFTQATTNNFHAHSQPYVEWMNDVMEGSLAATNTEGSLSDDSCTDEGSGDDTEPNPMDLVYDVVEALTPDKDTWADINQVIEKVSAMHLQKLDSEFCMEMIEDLVALNMFLINATRTKVRIKFREDCL